MVSLIVTLSDEEVAALDRLVRIYSIFAQSHGRKVAGVTTRENVIAGLIVSHDAKLREMAGEVGDATT